MEPGNHSRVTEFVLQGLLEHPNHLGLFFALFLCLYLAVILGNSLIIAAVVLHPPLHTPMYFFIANLAMLDIMCSSSVLPKMMENLLRGKKTISFEGCMAQLFAFTMSGATELMLLTVMSCDRYVAICHPLRYVNLMTKKICITLATGVWAVGIINSLVNTLLTLRLDFCGPNLIQHFFCEFPPVLALSCSSTFLNQVMVFLADIFLAMGNFLLTVMSYSFIIVAILKIRSSKGMQKAFSTCSSHLLVVTLFYSSIIYTYIRPSSSYSPDKDKFVALMYTLVTPILNPLIYSLRNKEVKVGFRKIFPLATKQFSQEQT
ncbi:olfactory receptor 13G1-like [Pelodiscus sinensis]|uniref:olfactory receptor 13G1-like n=1 Tax=Pelodiscus sinensis TaxID=13735 RepID=UPI003F6A8428